MCTSFYVCKYVIFIFFPLYTLPSFQRQACLRLGSPGLSGIGSASRCFGAAGAGLSGIGCPDYPGLGILAGPGYLGLVVRAIRDWLFGLSGIGEI